MRTIGVRNLQHLLGSYLDEVERGETIVVRRRGKPIAKIVPISPENPSPWPDLAARVLALYPDGAISPSASGVLYDDRG
jgi:prevent-host-death family protein